MTRTLAIDPGPETVGAVLYDTDLRVVLSAWNKLPVEDALMLIRGLRSPTRVVCERVQSYGISGGTLLLTAEVFGRFMQETAREGLRFRGLYRREVLRELDVTGKGSRDTLVRHRLIEMHGGHKKAAVGSKAEPGPLYGVTGHAWQALAVAVADAESNRRNQA